MNTSIKKLYSDSLKAIEDAAKIDTEGTLVPLKEMLQKSLDLGKMDEKTIIDFENLIAIIGVDKVTEILGADFMKMVEAMKKGNDKLKKTQEGVNTNSKNFWDIFGTTAQEKAQILTGMVGTMFDSISNAFATGFNAKNALTGLKEGFKSILSGIIDMITKQLILANISNWIMSLMPGVGAVYAGPNIALLIAAGAALQVAKAGIMAMAIGGMVNSPTMALVGEAGPELVAPKKDFLTIARELTTREVNTSNNNNYTRQRIDINISGALKGDGRDMLALVNTQTKLNNLRKL